jgi:hypothetical protein
MSLSERNISTRPTCARNVTLRTSDMHGLRGRSYSYSRKQRNQKHFGEHGDEIQGKCQEKVSTGPKELLAERKRRKVDSHPERSSSL